MANPMDPLMYMVFEYIEYDLTGLLNHADLKWEPAHIKCVARQLFQGIQHLHIHDIMHRDLKGANLLLSKDGVLKIADFGLARSIKVVPETLLPKERFDYTNRVVTLWYRSPELLLGATQYDFMVDIWSAG
jgi:CTD kinase subunit alpha